MDEPEREEGFKVTDRRRFTAEGEARESDAGTDRSKTTGTSGEDQTRATAGAKSEAGEPDKETTDKGLPPADFSALILSLANSALVYMGMTGGTDSPAPKDLIAAKRFVDMISLLQEKTKGNLTDQEQRLLNQMLFQLRMAFVEASK
jgi:hypothetical protein